MDQMELRLSARQAVAQAQLMAKEIDHRVTNSLQFISGMLSMQSRGLDRNTASHLQMAANRTKPTKYRASPSYADFVRISPASWQRKLKWNVIGKEPTTPIGLMLNDLIAQRGERLRSQPLVFVR
jgi:hypothetical protein